jgi:thiamine kinase-like enzyme
MSNQRLRRAAKPIDEKLNRASFQTLVHGDAKPANFCFGRGKVAAVDFQYVGGGCGMKDLAYLCSGEDRRSTEKWLDTYFLALGELLPNGGQVAEEWRPLYPWAMADFHRFMDGWSPGWRPRGYAAQLTDSVL